MIPCNIKIQGIAGGCKVKWKGTWKFAIEDEDGINRSIKFPTPCTAKKPPAVCFPSELESTEP